MKVPESTKTQQRPWERALDTGRVKCFLGISVDSFISGVQLFKKGGLHLGGGKLPPPQKSCCSELVSSQDL